VVQPLNAAFSANPQVGPAPLTVSFRDLSTGPVTAYFWSFGDGTGFSSARNPSYAYALPGTYTVSFTVFDSSSGLDTASTLIIVAVAPSPTNTFTPLAPTSTTVPTNVPTSTFTAIPPTATNTVAPPANTPTWTPSFTPTFTPSFTPAITPTSAPGSPCPQWDEPDIGGPDGNYCDLAANQQYIFDLSGNPIVTQAGYDFVFYEYGYPGPPPYVLMDLRLVDVGTTFSGPWITVFDWGNGVADLNTNVGAAGYGAGGEANGASVPMSVLYGTLPLQTGIAIDIDPIAGSGTYPFVRVRSYSTASNLEAIEVLSSGAPTPTFTPTATFTNTPATPIADLGLGMTVSNANPVLGETITYTITLANSSTDTTSSVQVSDVLPAGLTFVTSGASQGGYSAGIWDVGTVTGSGSATLSLTATVTGTPGSAINNVATITASSLPDPDSGNNSASAPITVRTTPVDLAVGMVVDNANPADGSAITYTLTVINTHGSVAVGSVQITSSLGAGLSAGTAIASQGTFAAGTWDVGFLPAGASATLTLPVTVQVGYAGATLNHTASVTGANQPETNASNSTASVPVNVQSADLSLNIAVDNPTPAQSATIVYTIILTNSGPNTATSAVVNAPLPSGVSYVSDDSGGAYNLTTWNVGSLASSTTATLNIVANVTAAGPATISFPVSVTASEPGDTNPANDGDNQDITVIPPPVAAFSAAPMSGEEPLDVVFTDSSSGSITSYDWNFGDGITSTQQNPLHTYTLPNIYNVNLTVTGPGGTDVETLQIAVALRSTDVGVTLSVDDTTPPAGATINYTVQVTNNGLRDTSGVVANFTIPAELTVNIATPSQGIYSGGTWTLDPIAVSSTATLTLNVTVGSVASGTPIDVSVSLSTPNHLDTNGGNNSDVETITVE
jgi:uncharacterized repeat protein (TIGR01451 family)